MKSTRMKVLVTVLALVATADAAQAANEVTVEIWNGGGSPRTTVLFDSSEAINASNGLPTIASTDTRVNIYTSGASYNIGRITFVADSRSPDLELFLGSGAFPTTQSNLSEVAVDWAGIATLPSELVGKVKLAGAISGDLTNSLSVKSIFRLEVADEIQAAVETTGAGTGAIARIRFGSSTSAGTISATTGDIDTIESLSHAATISGVITAVSGKITSIAAAGGINISSSTGIRARDGIDSIIAGYEDDNFNRTDIHAAINASYGGGLEDLPLKYLECDDLSGSVTAFTLGDSSEDPPITAMHVYGDLTAPIQVVYDMFGSLRVEGKFDGDAELKVFGSLYASVISHGQITLIGVEENIQHIDTGEDPLFIMSETAGIDGIQVGGNIERDDLREGFEVVILAAGTIGEITCEEFNGYIGHVDGEGYYVPITTFHSRSHFDGELWCSGFDTFIVGGLCAPDNGANAFARLNFVEIASGKVLRIGGDLGNQDETSIQINSGGLDGQVVINALNSGSPTTWNGPVVVLGSPQHDLGGYSSTGFYSDLSSTMGGGAVGLVPYNIHNNQCDPPNGATVCMENQTKSGWFTSPSVRETIVLSHYGKVIDSSSGGTFPFLIMKQLYACPPTGCPSSVNISSSCVMETGHGTNGREVWISMAPVGGVAQPFDSSAYRYTITPVASSGVTVLRSDQTGLGTAPNVYGYTYEIDTICD